MGMKLKSGADLCGFQLTNFCIQSEASAPSDAALGRKYFHTNATDDVATGISLLNRERVYIGESTWRATAYLDDIAAINEKLNLITGDTDTDTLINNLKDLEEFLKDFSETDKLKSLLDGKLDKSGGTISGSGFAPLSINRTSSGGLGILLKSADENKASLSWDYSLGTYIYNYASAKAIGIKEDGTPYYDSYTLIHSGNIGSYKAGDADKLDGFDSSYFVGQHKDTSQTLDANTVTQNHITHGSKWTNVPSSTIHSLLDLSYSSDWRAQLLFRPDRQRIHSRFYYEGTTWSDWKTIAFTDSNVASAQALTHSNGTIGAVVNSSGNVTIGASDLAGTSAKLYVQGSIRASNILFSDNYGVWNGSAYTSSRENTDIVYNATTHEFKGGNVLIGTTTDSGYKLDVNGNVRIKGNLIVDGEVSAKGAGAEEGTSGSGSAEGVSEIFTPTSTSMAFDHNLGEDVIVQVYEKSGNVWNMVIVDTEITSATRVTLRFGKTETTQHKVVIMGV